MKIGKPVKALFDKFVIFLTKNEEELRLEKLFDEQIEKLEYFGFPSQALEDLRKHRRKVVLHSLYHVFSPRYLNALPFCPVMPKYIWAEAFKNSLFRVNFRAIFDINPEELLRYFESDTGPSAHNPYFLIGFEPDTSKHIQGLNLKTAKDRLKRAEASPLTLEQLMSVIVVYPDLYRDGSKIAIIANKRGGQSFVRWLKSSFVISRWNFRGGTSKVSFPAFWRKKYFE